MLRAKQRLGKYVIQRKLGEGGFAVVYEARDTIEGLRVAVKIPFAHLVTDESMEDFRNEVRLAAKLDHPNILPLKCADFINGHFAIVTTLGKTTLEERLQKRLSTDSAIHFAKQMLQAVAYAHEHHIVHCDLKPDNFLIFPDNRLRLADFGIAKVAQKTLKGSGAGTLGYMAPEQAMGKPSYRSDVFALGVIMYRMFTGSLPEWPYEWPFPGHDKLKRRVHSDLIAVLRKATEPEARKRYKDAGQLWTAFTKVKRLKKQSASATSKGKRKTTGRDWKTLRQNAFQREFGKVLESKHECRSCGRPVSEAMFACPWCGKARPKHPADKPHRFTVACPRCQRGMKADWAYCAWCYGPGFEVSSNRQLSDQRYSANCDNPKCERRELMPFMRYCPWCRARVKKKWKLSGSPDKCTNCGCGVAKSYWSYCPWCTKKLKG